MNEIYPWQQALWQHLLDYIQQQRIPQALLVTGAAGLGLRQLIDVYTGSLLCHRPVSGQACGCCPSCKLLAAESHPDYMVIEPDEPGKAIGIDKIRQLIVKLALKPQFEAYRVVIIQPAERLNTASANAFLKCLEEPTERTCLILLTEQPSRLPATIRSRCQKISCALPDSRLATAWLKQQGVEQDADLLLALAQGAPLQAKLYAEQNLLAIRQDCFIRWLQLAQGKASFLVVVEQWLKQESLELTMLLGWMSTWVSDIVKYAHGGESVPLQNGDLKKPLQALAERLELQGLYKYYDSLLLARSLLTTQVNTQLLLEQLLIDWSQLNSR
jgi:DNA polymerase-3 subunit delta'